MALGRWARIDAPLPAWVLGGGTDVPLIAAVASQLTADGAETTPLQVGDGSHAPALLAQRCQCPPFFSLQMFVSRFHMRTLPVLGSVALRIGDRPDITCLGAVPLRIGDRPATKQYRVKPYGSRTVSSRKRG